MLLEKVREIYEEYNDIGTKRRFKNSELVNELKEANSGSGDIVSLRVEGKDIFVPQLFPGSRVSKDMVGFSEYLVYVYEDRVYDPLLTPESVSMEDYITALKVINGGEIIKALKN